jgi:hypothetical protein
MDFYVLKWGDKYGPEYVNRLYGSLKTHYKKPFTLTCYTDNYNTIREEVHIKNIDSLRKYDTDRVFTYEKLILMEKHEKGIWLDLDILIHKDITDLGEDEADFKMIWNYWNNYYTRSLRWYGKGSSCHVNSSFVKFENPEWLLKFTHDNWDKIEWTYKSLDKYLFYQHTRNDRLQYWAKNIVSNYNREGYRLRNRISLFNTSHIYNNKGINEESYELHEADVNTVKLWETYGH